MPRDGDCHRRGVLGLRSRRAARPRGRPGVSPRAERRGESYLRIDRDPRRRRAAPAPMPCIPGYGFLAENAAFARACRDAGLTFIGPSPDVISLMGSKTAARAAAIRAGVPVVPGTETRAARVGARGGDRAGSPRASDIRWSSRPSRAAAARACAPSSDEAALVSAIRTARSEARLRVRRQRRSTSSGGSCGRATSKCSCSATRTARSCRSSSASARSSGGTRRSSRSRRRWRSTPALRRRIAEAAASVARTVGYTNAGTIEFLLDEDGSFYFLEMNTRLQVEHPVTEMVTEHRSRASGRSGSRAASGSTSTRSMRSRRSGHAIECRIYAEDPDLGLHAVAGSDSRAAAGRRPGRPRRRRRQRRATRCRSSTTR